MPNPEKPVIQSSYKVRQDWAESSAAPNNDLANIADAIGGILDLGSDGTKAVANKESKRPEWVTSARPWS